MDLARVINRRSLLVGVGLAGAGSLLAQGAGGGQSLEDEIAACRGEPAIDMLFQWREGRPVYPSIAEASPPITWQSNVHPSALGPFLIPPGWRAVHAWADSFTPEGIPVWEQQPMQLPQLALSRVESEDGRASFEYAVGSIQQVLLTTEQTSWLARMSVTGPNPRLRSVCTVDNQHDPLAPNWFTGDRHGRNLLIAFGNAVALPHDTLPGSVVSFTSLYGPRRDMEQLMLDVFLRILYQFLGGGSSDPTPTPTA